MEGKSDIEGVRSAPSSPVAGKSRRVRKVKKANMARNPSQNPWIVFYKHYYQKHKAEYNNNVTLACKAAAEVYKQLTPEQKLQLVGKATEDKKSA